jgi:hypothetical protein
MSQHRNSVYFAEQAVTYYPCSVSVSLDWENKIKIRSMVSPEGIGFLHHHEIKKKKNPILRDHLWQFLVENFPFILISLKGGSQRPV